MKVIDKKYETNYERVSDFLEDISVDVMHIKNLLEVLVNTDSEDLQASSNVDLIHIAHDYAYKTLTMIDDVIEKIDVTTPLKEQRKENRKEVF